MRPGPARYRNAAHARVASFHSDHPVRKRAKLIAARTDVPWLCDQFCPAQLMGSCAIAAKKPVWGIETIRATAERRRKIEAKANDMTLLDPVSQRSMTIW